MNLRVSLLTLLASCSLCYASEKPNFVIIYTDDLVYQDLSCYGSKNISTPHIDQMAVTTPPHRREILRG